MNRYLLALAQAVVLAAAVGSYAADSETAVSRSARSGQWSAAATWETGRVPDAGARVLVREGHTVLYDIASNKAIRAINVAGTLTFATDRDTRLDVGLIKIQTGDEFSEEGFACDAHLEPLALGHARPALLVGTPNQPVDPNHTALIRLVYFEGMDKQSCPAIVSCAGRMELHGAPLNRTWVKLGEPAKTGDTTVTLDEEVVGWRVGDQLVLTATTRQNKAKKTFTAPSLRGHSQSENRIIKAIDGKRITVDRALEFDHVCNGAYRGDVANLSRNVVVESADPDVARGHTMYHRDSAGSINYAEFRHLGKPGVLGRYSLHFHLAGDTMRGSSVIGASIWDSGNRWLTIHSTNYLVVRDCVGYQSQGHGFFMEDGTEVYNVLDRNLAVDAFTTQPLPKQVFPFDKNDGSGFWWANSLNTFTRNVAAECDEYGYFFQAAKTADFDPVLPIRQPDGSLQKTDIRTLPFVRFEDNEAHCQRRHAFNLGGGVPFGEPNVDGVGPDANHPFVIRNFRVWNSHWAIHPVSPSVMLDRFDAYDGDYGIWRPEYMRHSYRGVSIDKILPENRYAFAKGTNPVGRADFPAPLAPIDDQPPTTVITHIQPLESGKLLVRGTTADNGEVSKVTINGHDVRQLAPNYAEWELTLATPSDGKLTAVGKDTAGNVEQTPHVRMVEGP
jgi:hypothetical protein